MSFSSITNDFYSKLKGLSKELGTLIFSRKTGVNQYSDDVLKRLQPIYDDLFSSGKKASVSQIRKDITKLVGKYDVPLKYNKDLLVKMNSQSVFTGYFDTKYKDVFTKTEINKLKNTILQAKYAGLSEAQLQTNIINTVSLSKKKAQQLARYEIQRLRSVTLQEYYAIPKMKKKYNKVFVVQEGARATHQAYNGKVADKDGYVDGPLGKVKETPIPGEYNCRCRFKLVKKKEK